MRFFCLSKNRLCLLPFCSSCASFVFEFSHLILWFSVRSVLNSMKIARFIVAQLIFRLFSNFYFTVTTIHLLQNIIYLDSSLTTFAVHSKWHPTCTQISRFDWHLHSHSIHMHRIISFSYFSFAVFSSSRSHVIYLVSAISSIFPRRHMQLNEDVQSRE